MDEWRAWAGRRAGWGRGEGRARPHSRPTPPQPSLQISLSLRNQWAWYAVNMLGVTSGTLGARRGGWRGGEGVRGVGL